MQKTEVARPRLDKRRTPRPFFVPSIEALPCRQLRSARNPRKAEIRSSQSPGFVDKRRDLDHEAAKGTAPNSRHPPSNNNYRQRSSAASSDLYATCCETDGPRNFEL